MATVLITGASSGLGAELAALFARQGWDLILVARRGDRLRQMKDEIVRHSAVNVCILEADLSRPEVPQVIYQAVHAKGLAVDMLINNAGIGVYGDFLQCDFDKVINMNQVNVLAVLHLTRLFLPGMVLRARGHVVNVASMGAFFPGPLMAAYFAAKADIHSFTRALAFELRGTPITFTTACPGPFKSEFQKNTFGPQRNTAQDERLASSRQIAGQVFDGIMKKKELVIPGLRNKIIYLLSRILPGSLILRSVFRAQKKLA